MKSREEYILVVLGHSLRLTQALWVRSRATGVVVRGARSRFTRIRCVRSRCVRRRKKWSRTAIIYLLKCVCVCTQQLRLCNFVYEHALVCMYVRSGLRIQVRTCAHRCVCVILYQCVCVDLGSTFNFFTVIMAGVTTDAVAVLLEPVPGAFQAFPSTTVCVIFSVKQMLRVPTGAWAMVKALPKEGIVVAAVDVEAATPEPVAAAAVAVVVVVDEEDVARPLLVISSSLKATTTLRLLDTIPPLLDVDPGLRRLPL